MIVVGVTGSIAMGKSTVCKIVRRLGIPVFDADAVVHRLLQADETIFSKVASRYPETVTANHKIDHQLLGKSVWGKSRDLKWLENLVHPVVRRERNQFLATMRRQGKKIVVLDVPLLYETRAERKFDLILVVSAPIWIQRRRVMARTGMTAARYRHIMANQMPDAVKRKRADCCIETGKGFLSTRCAVEKTFESLRRFWRK